MDALACPGRQGRPDDLPIAAQTLGRTPCRQLVDEVVLVDEEQIADAMRWAIEVHHLVVEGSGALGIAALRARLGGLKERRAAVVLTGRNVDGATLRSVLASD